MKFASAKLMLDPPNVAPLVGAWIEIYLGHAADTGWAVSLPSWERGLKFRSSWLYGPARLVAPLVGAWIEIDDERIHQSQLQSLPSWERGLKYPHFLLTFVSYSRSPRGSVD